MSDGLPGELRVVKHVPLAFAQTLQGERFRSIALSGGTTARECYELLAVTDLPWNEVEVYFSDERWVPVDDPDSNEGMARRVFLDSADVKAIHSMRHAAGKDDEGPDPIGAAADAYDRLLRSSDPIDVVHLGVGPDGHTASLFPGTPTLEEKERLVVPSGDDLHPYPRLTFTFPAIARCRLAIVTVEGESKRPALEAIRRGDDLPAAHIAADRVLWLVDPAAAGDARG
ncbi:MAG: phosphogluconate dehydrogenase ((+)-dependent, decarboxylating) [Actinomycetia bacterium]|nr:phosphogluconate dehydrogenase ((+)-dependent, decarboxylating) [Actinomycetes bacterium]